MKRDRWCFSPISFAQIQDSLPAIEFGRRAKPVGKLNGSKQPPPVTENRNMISTKDVVAHHLQCFGKGDLEGILSDYAPGAVLFTPDGPLQGTGRIKPLFQAMIAEFAKPGAVFTLKQQFVEGDYAYILWSAETADNLYELGTDTFFVRQGKIVAQSFTGKISRKG